MWRSWRYGSVVSCNSARRQEQAVRAIFAHGGTIEYDYECDATTDRRLPKGKPSRPLWLRRLLGDDYFHDVVMVGMDVDEAGHDLGATDDDLVHLECLRQLRLLYLGGGRITDDGLQHLQNLTELRLLVLWKNPISGEGLKHLGRLRKLRHLDLSKTAVTDDKLTELKNQTHLERIDLANNPQLTGSFLEQAASLPYLEGPRNAWVRHAPELLL